MPRSHKYKFRRASLILVVFVIFSAIHLYVTTQNISLKYQLTELKIKLAELKSNNRLLGSQISARENLRTIEEKARQELKMIYPEKINYILVSKEATN